MQPPFIQDEPPEPARKGAKASDTRVARIALKVVPGARKDAIAGMLGATGLCVCPAFLAAATLARLATDLEHE